MTHTLVIRPHRADDVQSILDIHRAAFPTDAESRLVAQLFVANAATLSLVAEREGAVIGHILFSPVTIDSARGQIIGVGLAPVAVSPTLQHAGVGSKLIEAGIEQLSRDGQPFAVVLGHPHYYPRFNFERASDFGVRCQWPVPDDAFMIRILNTERMRDVTGTARYRDEFSAVM
jgi:putative acetyltransferase